MIPLQSKFQSSRLIKRFGELKYFLKITYLGSGVNSFNDCANLEYINLDNITYIAGNTGGQNSTGSPLDYTNLTSIVLPNCTRAQTYCIKNHGWWNGRTMTDIGPLRIVVFGKLTTITGSYAFSYANRVSIFIYAKTPATGDTLNKNGYPTAIYVHDDVVDDYKAAPAFANWVSYIKPLSEYTGEKPWEELYPEELGLV
ncbi:MAG: hypothetical protein IJK82_06015 [Prevotella sp.]|nr:hypothetical protein [Prevotella sp.]